MADFQPKFVDLVRNYSTTTGTGNFTLGPAVNGFTSFAAACKVGDTFYYSAIGVDKPAEREVGRGTLLAGNAISREPIGGAAKTNFSGGTKSIALIAAAEWFEAAHALMASVTPIGEALASAAGAIEARAALGLGTASLVDSDADTALTAASDLKVPTQKAVKAYVDAHGGGGSAAMADRAALADSSRQSEMALLREAGREGTFLFESGDLSAQVAADTAQGLFVAPSSDISGASGAWVRDHKGKDINPAWFGLIEGDDPANASANDAALAAMISALVPLSASSPDATNRFLRRIRVPDGIYWVGSGKAVGDAVLDLTNGTLALEGEGANSSSGGYGTTFKLASACHFVRTQTETTSGDSAGPVASHPSGKGSEFRNFTVVGNYTAAGGESEAHGFMLRSTATIDNVTVKAMPGDGFHIAASLSASGANANQTRLTNCHGVFNRINFYFDGADANAGSVTGCSGSSARQADFWDSSLIGNGFSLCLAESVGSAVSVPPCAVHYLGNRFRCKVGQEAGASTNAPPATATDNIWWLWEQAGGIDAAKYPDWLSGTTYRAGGSYINDNINQKNAVYVGCYDESNGTRAQLGAPAMIQGGVLAINPLRGADNGWGPAVVQRSSSGAALALGGPIWADNGSVNAWLGGTGYSATNVDVLVFNEPTTAPSGYYLKCRNDVGDVRFTYNNSTAITQMPYVVTGPNTTQQYGTGASAPHRFYAPLLMVPSANSIQSNGRRLMIDSADPTTTVHAVGDWRLDRGGTAGLIGGKCTAAGTPGTWQPLYAMTGAVQSAWTAWTGTGSKAAKAVGTATVADCAAAIKSLIDDLKARGVLA